MRCSSARFSTPPGTCVLPLCLVLAGCTGEAPPGPGGGQVADASSADAEPDAGAAAPPGEGPFVGRRGTRLFLDGEELREISFNKFDLWGQFVDLPNEHPGDLGWPAAFTALGKLGEKGFRMVRVNCSPFYPVPFERLFFAADANVQAAKRAKLFAEFDEMLDACDRHGVKVVATLLWNLENVGDLGRHALREGLVDGGAPARRKIEEYVRAVVGRYRDRPTIAMWEIGNEWDLGGDLQFPGGIIPAERVWPEIYPPGVVRDGRNNFTNDELGAFFGDLARVVRSVDPNHLITTGVALRPSGMHMLRASRAGDPIDWTQDSEADAEELLRLLHPDPIDVISIHYYDGPMEAFGGRPGSPDNLSRYKAIADRIGKPLFIGEIGLYAGISRYDDPRAVDLLRITLPVLAGTGIPLTLYWTLHDDRVFADDTFGLRYGVTDEALQLIEDAGARARR